WATSAPPTWTRSSTASAPACASDPPGGRGAPAPRPPHHPSSVRPGRLPFGMARLVEGAHLVPAQLAVAVAVDDGEVFGQLRRLVAQLGAADRAVAVVVHALEQPLHVTHAAAGLAA